MQKITVGRRKNQQEEIEHTVSSDWLMLTGLCTMCLMLILAMMHTDSGTTVDSSDVVAVMSSAVESAEAEREELVLPDKNASAVSEESVFETIGEFFASLIMGEG